MDVAATAALAMGMQQAQTQQALQIEIVKQALSTDAQVLDIIESATQALPPVNVGVNLDIVA